MTAGRRGGFALLAALWLLVALSTVGLEVGLAARERRLAVANVLDEARARHAAEAALETTRARLELLLRGGAVFGTATARGSLDPWANPEALAPAPPRLTGSSARVTLGDAGARLNLNRATEDELRRLLRALRVDFGRADIIAQSVMDWRDPDDFRRARGAERAEYLRAGRGVLPRNGPFESLRELRGVNGMSDEVFGRVRPYLTLTGSGVVNLAAAPLPVLLALPGISPQAAMVLGRERGFYSRVHSLQDLLLLLPAGPREELTAAMPELLRRTAFETREVVVEAEGRAEGGNVRARIEALLVRSGTTAFLVWRRTK